MRCVHCLKETKITRDHVFPKAWYPADTPEKTQRPTAPSCAECNASFGEIEDHLFQKLAVCIDPETATASGINEKMLKSFGYGVDKEVPDRVARIARLKKLLDSTVPYDPRKVHPFPGLGPHAGLPMEMQHAFPAPVTELTAISEKIVRGMEYWLTRRYVDPSLQLKTYLFVRDETLPVEVKYLLSLGAQHVFGPGFEVTRVADSKNLVVLYKFIIWGTVKGYGSISVPE